MDAAFAQAPAVRVALIESAPKYCPGPLPHAALCAPVHTGIAGPRRMKFVIKCTSEAGFDFPADIDYADYFPAGMALSEAAGPAHVQADFPWGVGVFTFGTFVVNAVFTYKSIDFGYTEPFMEAMAQIVSDRTGQPAKWYQVPVRK